MSLMCGEGPASKVHFNPCIVEELFVPGNNLRGTSYMHAWLLPTRILQAYDLGVGSKKRIALDD